MTRKQGASPSESANRQQPPEIVYRIVNPVIKTILRSPLHLLLSHMLMTLTFTGRKTGKRYTIPVGYQQEGESLIVFTHHSWWKNLRGGAPVTMRLRGAERQGWAEPVTDAQQVLRRVREFLQKNGSNQARQLGITLENENPSEEELRRAVEGSIFIRIQLQNGSAGEVETEQ